MVWVSIIWTINRPAPKLCLNLFAKGEITNILSIVGRWDLNRNYIIAPLAPWSERSRSQLEIAKALREPLKAIPGATARVRTPNSLNLQRAGGRVEFTLTGSNYRDIAAAADDFLNVLRERAPGLDDLEIEFQQTQPQLSLTVDRRRADDLESPIEGIVNTLRAMVDGFESGGTQCGRSVCAGSLGIDGRCDRRS